MINHMCGDDYNTKTKSGPKKAMYHCPIPIKPLHTHEKGLNTSLDDISNIAKVYNYNIIES